MSACNGGAYAAHEAAQQADLLDLLQLYETAIRELEALRDPAVSGLLRRMEEHRDEVIAALADQDAAA